jgi:hypothetical protein
MQTPFLKKIALDMKALVVLVFSLLMMQSSRAQESWKIRVNGLTALSASTENPEKNKITIKRSALRNSKSLEVIFSEKNDKKEWDRFLAIYSPDDEEILQKMSTKLTISNKKLLVHLQKHKKLTVYTWMLPTDPDLRSRIRIRRIHLCTLVLQ